MPNFYTDQYNAFLASAESIYNFLSGNYMNIYEGRLLECTQFTDTINAMKIIKIAGFRKMQDDLTTFNTLKTIISATLSSFHRCDCAVGYFIISNKHGFGL